MMCAKKNALSPLLSSLSSPYVYVNKNSLKINIRFLSAVSKQISQQKNSSNPYLKANTKRPLSGTLLPSPLLSRAAPAAFPTRMFTSSQSSSPSTEFKGILPTEPAALWKKELLIDCNDNGLVHVTLNRTKYLNALSYDMFRTLSEYLVQMDTDERCRAIIVTGSGEKAFCAGGDVKAVTDADPNFVRAFFGTEYLLDYRTSILKKPYLCIWKGYVMGGGAGLSVHGRYRVATDSTIFSMPETTIGLFPDVGVQYELARLKDGLGLYAALTSARLNAADVMNHGLATHFIQQDKIEDFIRETKEAKFGNLDESHKVINELLLKYKGENLSKIQPLIDEKSLQKIKQYFTNVKSIKELMANLKKEASSDEFCKKTVEVIMQKCPLSCAVWFKQHELSHTMTLADCLRMDYALVQSFCIFNEYNLHEGVRAQLIDKDHKPKWSPKTIEELDDSVVDEMFECPKGERFHLLDAELKRIK